MGGVDISRFLQIFLTSDLIQKLWLERSLPAQYHNIVPASTLDMTW